MRALSLEPLPFQTPVLSAPELDVVRHDLVDVRARFALAESPIERVIEAYLKWCSPSSAPRLGLRLGAAYLAWFFAINDLASNPEKQQLVADIRAVLNGAQPTLTHPLLDTTRAFQAELREGGLEDKIGRFIDFVELMFDAFAWEIAHASQVPVTGDYVRYRTHFVAVFPYLELWRLVLELPDGDSTPDLVRLEQLGTELTFLVNDLLSVERDQRERKHNLVFCLVRDHAGDEQRAEQAARAALQERVDEFASVRRSTLLGGEQARCYADFLGSVAEGTRLAMLELSARYPRHEAESG
ncbi:MAG: terpene synthase family protein [Polyangiaceae bacterium]